jgi:hypothetical protein
VEGSLDTIVKAVEKLGPLPQDAIAAGYPAMVLDIAQRALSAKAASFVVEPQGDLKRSPEDRGTENEQIPAGWITPRKCDTKLPSEP